MVNEGDAYSGYPLTILSMIDCVCARPKMYTPNGTLAEVAAFLEGYYFGLHRGGVSQELSAWSDFRRWLQSELNCSGSVSWFGALLNRFSDDAEALEKLREWFRSFQENNPTETTVEPDRRLGGTP